MIPTKRKMYKILQALYNRRGFHDDIKHPTTFTAKIKYLGINGDLNLMAKLADKHLVKPWVEEKIGEKYVIKTLGVWKNANEIDFKSLPNQFVFKANHGSNFIYVVKDKSKENWQKLKPMLEEWLDTSFGWYGLEIHYFGIPRRIIAEEYISQMDGNLLDYKVHCFDGKPAFIQVIGDRDIDNHTAMQENYNFEWKRLPWTFEDYPAYKDDLPKPAKLYEIYEVSKKLSKGFSYVRVDLYLIEDSVKFGEMTFTPSKGIYPYKGTWTEKYDKEYGAMIPIPMETFYSNVKQFLFLRRADMMLHMYSLRRHMRKLRNRIIGKK